MYPTTVQKATTVYIPIFTQIYLPFVTFHLSGWMLWQIYTALDLSSFCDRASSVFDVKDIVEDDIFLNHALVGYLLTY